MARTFVHDTVAASKQASDKSRCKSEDHIGPWSSSARPRSRSLATQTEPVPVTPPSPASPSRSPFAFARAGQTQQRLCWLAVADQLRPVPCPLPSSSPVTRTWSWCGGAWRLAPAETDLTSPPPLRPPPAIFSLGEKRCRRRRSCRA